MGGNIKCSNSELMHVCLMTRKNHNASIEVLNTPV